MTKKPWYPDDDPRWQEFAPGDPMPCEDGTVVETLWRYERKSKSWESGSWSAFPAMWEVEDDPDYDIIAWRPE